MKLKLEMEIDVDIQQIFSEIPEGVFAKEDLEMTEYDYECFLRESIGSIINKAHTTVMMERMRVLAHTPDMMKYHDHHLKIDEQITEQMYNTLKIPTNEQLSKN